MTDPVWEERSPDGRTLVRWVETDGRMSHVIRTPTIVDAAGGAPILALGDSGYDAAVDWAANGGFEIDLRHYWRPGTLRLRVDRETGTFQPLAPAGAPRPLAGLSAFVEAQFAAGPEGLARQAPSGKGALFAMLALGAGAAIWALFLRR